MHRIAKALVTAFFVAVVVVALVMLPSSSVPVRMFLVWAIIGSGSLAAVVAMVF